MLTKEESIAIIIGLVGFIVILLAILISKRRNKQGYTNTELKGLGTRVFPVVDFNQENAELLAWWKKWTNDLPEDVMSSIYALCPDIEDDDAIRTYGLTKRMVDMIKKLKPAVSNINKRKLEGNMNEIKKYFNSCISTGVGEIGIYNGGVLDKNDKMRDWDEYNFVV